MKDEEQRLLSNLKESIAEKIAEAVIACHDAGKVSELTISDVKEIVSSEINSLGQDIGLDNAILRKKLITMLDSHYKFLEETLAQEAIYNSDYPFMKLERNESQFFARESLLSLDKEYIE